MYTDKPAILALKDCPAKNKMGQKWYQPIDISAVFGRWVLFENLKGPRPLNLKKLFAVA
jgi:predicted solute-binding protein